MRTSFISILILLFFSSALPAQDIISLQAYRDSVLSYSKVLKQSKEQLFASIAKEKVAYTGYLPKIDLGVQGSLDFMNLDAWSEEVGVYRNHTYNGTATLSQSIYSGGAITGQYKAAQIESDIAHQVQRLTLNNVIYQAEVVYWNAAANAEILTVANEYYAIVNELFSVINIRYQDGAIGKTDLLMITTRLKEAELQNSIAAKNYMLAMQNLNILMGKQPNKQYPLQNSISEKVYLPQTEPLEKVIQQRPDYKQATLGISLQEQYRKIALSKYNPQLGLQVSGGWGTYIPNYSQGNTVTGIAALSLNIPLLYWGARHQTNVQNKAAIQIKKWEQESIADRITQELSAAITNIEQSSNQIILAQQNLDLADENLQLITFSYNEGRIPIVDVLSAQLTWISAYQNFISAHLNHKVAIADYHRTIGE